MNPAESPNRWRIVFAGIALQICLGTVYAWSIFQNRLIKTYDWSNSQVAGVFCLAILSLGIAAACGGAWLRKSGPRRVAVAGGALFGLGYLVAMAALHFKMLSLLYIGYGLIGGVGLGLGYVTPVATAEKWFPDRKGLATGMVVMGFGFGALFMSKILEPLLMNLLDGNLVNIFGAFGLILGTLSVVSGAFLHNPPADWTPPPTRIPIPADSTALADNRRWLNCILSPRFAMMWLVFFCNITAGIALISFQSPLLQDMWRQFNESVADKELEAYGATLVAVSSLFNGVGRMGWGWLSDQIGRAWAFRCMLGTEALAFALLLATHNPWIFGALVCYVLFCYGGGFGTMPSFVSDVFGKRLMPNVYGAILTAWAAAGVVGPQLVALAKDHWTGQIEIASRHAFTGALAVLAIGLLLAFILREQPRRAFKAVK